MAYKVTKNIPKGDGSFVAVGEIVSGDGWRNLKSLISNRYLIAVSDVIVPSINEIKPQPKAKTSSVKG